MSRKPNGWLVAALLAAAGLLLFSRTKKGQDLIQSAISRSERNNNPGNIRKGSLWLGTDPSRSDSDFVVFVSPEYGFRAMTRILRGYFDRGLDTVQDIIGTWAPSNENNTAAYVDAVSKWVGVNPDTTLDFDTNIYKLLTGIARHETGYWPNSWTAYTVNKGIELEAA